MSFSPLQNKYMVHCSTLGFRKTRYKTILWMCKWRITWRKLYGSDPGDVHTKREDTEYGVSGSQQDRKEMVKLSEPRDRN